MFPEYSLCPQSTVFQFQEYSLCPQSTVYVLKVQFLAQRTVYVLRAQLMFPEYSLSP